LLHRADEILHEVQAEEFAHLSEILPGGFDQRLARLGDLLVQTVESGASQDDAFREARDAIRRHDQARREPRRMERIEMALRLVRWLKVSPVADGPRSFAEAPAATWTRAVSWTGPVRAAGGRPRSRPVGGYARLLGRIAERREVQNRHFAELLRDQQAAGSTAEDPIPVEGVLDEVVACWWPRLPSCWWYSTE